MQKQIINIEQLRQALMLAKDTKYIGDDEADEMSYQIFKNAKQALSAIDTNKIYELKNEVFALLQCDNEIIRDQAIATLCFSTRLYLEEFKDAAYELWLNDPSDYVKSTALASWAQFYRHTKDKNVLQKLYKILIDNDSDSSVRATAYRCLFNTIEANHPDYHNHDFDKLLYSETAEEFNNNVNWNVIHTIMRQYAPDTLID